MLDGVSNPPGSAEILRRLVADEMAGHHGAAVNVPAVLARLGAELPADIPRDDIVQAIILQATMIGLAVEFDGSTEASWPSRESSGL